MTAGGGKPATGVGRSKRKRTASAEPAAPVVGGTFQPDLASDEGILAYREKLAAELHAKGASYKRSVQIGHEIRLAHHAEKRLEQRAEEQSLDRVDKNVAEVLELQKIMRSGVQRADQAPELPSTDGTSPN